MIYFYSIFFFCLFGTVNAQVFDWSTWVNNSLSGTLSNGSCNMSVNVTGSNWNTGFTGPYRDGTLAADPSNGTGLALDHNWTNITTSTTVTMNFSASANNPSFSIFDINRQGPCAAFCGSSWTDRVVVTTSPAAVINVTQAQPSEQTVTGNGTGTVTIVGNMVCNGVNGSVTINITGTVNSITVTYSSGPTVNRNGGSGSCSNPDGGASCLTTRTPCTDPGRQFITIGNVNAPCCSASVNDPSDQTRCVGVATSAVNFIGSPGTTSFNWSNNNTGTGLAASGSGNIASFLPTGSGTSTITVTPSNGSCNGAPQVFTITANPNHTITAAANRTVCRNAAMSAINMTLGGGASNATASGLPTGVNLSVSGTTATISGTPSVSGTFNYTVTTTGNACTVATRTGTITVDPIHTLTAGGNQTACVNSAMTSITMTLGGGATNAALSAGSLPTGVSLSVSGTTATISGTPSVSGTFNYTVTTSGNACTVASRSGTITVNPVHTITSGSNRTVCTSSAMTSITMTLGGGATFANVSGLPPGVVSSVSGTTLTISGTPTAAGSFNYSVTTTGNACATANASGVIDVISSGGTRLVPTGPQCAGTTLNFTSAPSGGNGVYTINWGADRDNNGSFELSGSGTNFSFTSSNVGTAAITNPVQLTVTSNGINCTQTFNPTINPIPTVNDPADQNLCSGLQTAAVNFTGNAVPATVFNWSNNNTAIGLPASGSGNIAAFTAQTGIASVTVTPTANGCTGASQVFNFDIEGCNLPVEFLYFNGRKETEGFHYLYWATASETNCAFYEIEHSLNTVDFNVIGKVLSQTEDGNSPHSLYYDFVYYPTTTNVHYYRLKQFDFDGGFDYSNSIAIAEETETTIIGLYPNPANDNIRLQVPITLIGQKYQIFDIQGRFVKSGVINNMNSNIDLNELTKGNYILFINEGIYRKAFSIK